MARRPSPLALVRSILLLFATLALLGSAVGAQDEGNGTPRVIVLPTSGVVDQIMAEYLRAGIARGEDEGVAAVVIELGSGLLARLTGGTGGVGGPGPLSMRRLLLIGVVMVGAPMLMGRLPTLLREALERAATIL